MSESLQHTIESDPIFKERLFQEALDLLVSRTRYLLIIACFLYTSFWGLDWVSTADHAGLFLAIRLVVMVNYLLGILLLSRPIGRRIAVALSVWVVYVSVLGIAVMTVFMNGFLSTYYIGILFVLFVAGLFLPWTVTPTVICGLLSIITYFGINFSIGFDPTVGLTYIVSPFFFLSGAVIFTVFANVGKAQTRSRDLRLRMQIEKANEDLNELDKAKTRFFSNVSHELRSPLTLILGPLEAILQGDEASNPRPLLEAIEANARKLLRQVNALLDFSKIDAGKLKCKYAYGNLGMLLQELTVAARSHTERRNIHLSIQGEENVPDSIMDIDKVETIAANLISNAIKFTPDGGRIMVRADSDEHEVRFEVEDTGAGIPEDQLESIFERFLQLDDTLSRRTEGTGLGLSMVKELSSLHGGKVSVRSKVGKGTAFLVQLPRQPEMSPLERRQVIGRRRIDRLAHERTVSMLGLAYEESVSTRTLLSDVAGAKLADPARGEPAFQQTAPPDAPLVLVVDDNPDLRAFIAGCLASTYRVETAEDGIMGLETARRILPDLMILDIMMPKMDGYEVCRQIRRDSSLAQVPVILATSKSGGGAVVEGLEVGANDYIAKPFEIRELKARVAAHLRTRSLEKSLHERESRLSAIGQMTSSIIHDLKNPLTVIICFAEIAKEDALRYGSDNAVQNLNPVIDEAKRLGRMITEILDFAKGYGSDIRMEPTPLVPYLESICIPLRTKLEAIGISLTLQHSVEETLRIDLDPDRMQRVLENLLKNAQEAFRNDALDAGDKHIWIKTNADPQSVTIRVADNGPGIAEEMIQTLFEPFVTAGKKTGTGLGLSTVRNLVKAQGGEISFEARGQEGGTAFSLKFPLNPNSS